VTSCLDGYNVCIMAYGQTGSGKTYTMIGTDKNPGLYFSSVEELFDKINERKGLINYEVTVSFVEIYNEHLRDLLSKKGQDAGTIIKLRENGNGETISDQQMKPVKSKN
jgi:kinesin family protein C2/C3